tara:strand:+ start:107 stop:520 length:414 start_codon:yes stop_codon:yes gene_type:complete
MKKIIKYILVFSINLIFCFNLNNESPEFIDYTNKRSTKINNNQTLSILSNSINGSMISYGVYGNNTTFKLNRNTQLYSDVNIAYPMSSINSISNKLDYSIKIGMKYKINENIFLGVEFNQINNLNSLPFNQYQRVSQ